VTPLLAALAAAALLGGGLLILAGLRPVPAPQRPAARPVSPCAVRLRQLLAGDPGMDRAGAQRRRWRLMMALGAGTLGWLLTGLVLLVVVLPVAALGLPRVLSPRAGSVGIDRLEALEEWTRNLAGVLAVGVGLEQALAASLRSAPEPIRPQVTALVGRVAARWQTDTALRAFAEELGDATGDLVAASLILSAQRRGAGLVAVLEGLAASVAEDVRARRAIEADRAKPRSTARAVTLITLVVLVLLLLNGTYIQPYTSTSGQLLLAVLLAAYGGALAWMHQITATPPAPRFLAPTRPGPVVTAIGTRTGPGNRTVGDAPAVR
jgi:Flp pilus assembly protein TadB